MDLRDSARHCGFDLRPFLRQRATILTNATVEERNNA